MKMNESTNGAGHTPGPYALARYGNTMFEIQDATRQVVVLKNCDLTFAQRVTACVNACEGISTEGLTDGCVKLTLQSMSEARDTVASERDALRAECARLREALEECVTETPGAACYNTGKKTRRLEAINETVRAALTGARP